jgi:hypothetical protein
MFDMSKFPRSRSVELIFGLFCEKKVIGELHKHDKWLDDSHIVNYFYINFIEDQEIPTEYIFNLQ